MKKENHQSKKRHGIAVAIHAQLKDKQRRSNVSVRITGAERVPLLLGKTQLGTAHNDQRELLLEKLALRRIDAYKKENITSLKKMLMENECPNTTTDPNHKKCFLPKF